VPITPTPTVPFAFAQPDWTAPAWTVTGSPIGPLRLASDGSSVTQLFMSPFAEPPDAWAAEGNAVLTAAVTQLAEYFDGARTSFDLPLAPSGTAFQRRVWAALLTIPYGATTTYGAIANQIGYPGKARAVGAANGANPISIIVPCHRVIGANGSLTGYGGGLPRKAELLRREGGLGY
jgi:methylated-DNA-[protein]-cysteine S-methyltransferase